MGKHEAPESPEASEKAKLARRKRIRRLRTFHAVGHCLGEFVIGGATIVVFEWFRHGIVHVPETHALVVMVANVIS